MKFARFALIAGISIAGIVGAAQGGYTYVGGDKFSKVLVEFSDGAFHAFGVSYSNPNTTGIGLMDIIEDYTTLTTVRVNDPYFGIYIDGISYNGHSNSGYGGGEQWWHYWVKEPATTWELSWIGASSRTASDGGADGWVYGRDGALRLPGDTNGDVYVNASDLGDFAANWGKTGKGWAEGDFNGDGNVDVADLGDMATYWGFGNPPASPPPPAPLPEPATAVLLAAGLTLLLRRRME